MHASTLDRRGGLLSLPIGMKNERFQMLNAENKLEELISMDGHISSELFSLVDALEIPQILNHSSQFQRYQLISKFNDNALIRLLYFLNENEISQSFSIMPSSKLHRILLNVKHDEMLDLITKMSIKDQLRAFTCQSKDELNEFRKQLTHVQKKVIVRIFINLRVSLIYKERLDHTFLGNINRLHDFLDNLSELFSIPDLILILKSHDPIFVFSRFTPKERRFLKYLMTRSQIMLILLLYGKNDKNFPTDFFPGISNKFCLSNHYDWRTFWADLKFAELNSISILIVYY